jgi:midasin
MSSREREDAPAADPADLAEADGAGATSDDVGAQHGVAPAKAATQLHTNPLRNLGDALREIRQQMDDILNASERPMPQATPQPSDADGKLEYLRPDDEDQDMEALGPAGEEEAARLSELKIVDDEQAAAPDQAPMDVDAEMPEDMQIVPPAFSARPEASATAIQEDVQSAITDAQVRAQTGARRTPEIEDPPPRRDQDDREDGDVPEEERVEAALKQWQEDGCRAEDAAELWRLYESLTHDLSYTLCEQLRLILAPTLATRLRGDYRTGKRLNMKKIVPYVASEYTKDKIWLRRTRPSAREYEVLLAVDDSRSMAASRSVHLAFETLALVARALGRLEVGRVALARFGRDVELVHGFEDGPLGAAAGARALGAFSFAQRATDVLGLLETSLGVLARARERRASASAAAADLWQLMLIVSDGVVQDRERVRTVLRRAEEQRVMVVFVILDALHAATGADAAGGGEASTSGVAGGEGASIVSMKQAVYRDVGGRMEIEYEGYLDSFPFEYYVVLRRAEALPDVLASTLRQFFERVSGE